MALTVMSLATNPGDPLYYTEEFRRVIETHLNILKRSNVQLERISNDKVYQFEGNFYGLLNELGVAANLHWIYLRVNEMENPNQFGKAMRDPQNREVVFDLIHPNPNAISNIRALYLTKKR